MVKGTGLEDGEMSSIPTLGIKLTGPLFLTLREKAMANYFTKIVANTLHGFIHLCSPGIKTDSKGGGVFKTTQQIFRS